MACMNFILQPSHDHNYLHNHAIVTNLSDEKCYFHQVENTVRFLAANKNKATNGQITPGFTWMKL